MEAFLHHTPTIFFRALCTTCSPLVSNRSGAADRSGAHETAKTMIQDVLTIRAEACHMGYIAQGHMQVS